MLEDTAAAISIEQQSKQGETERKQCIRVISLDEDWDLISKQSSANLPIQAGPDNLASRAS